MQGDDGKLVAACFAGVNFWNIAFLEMLWVDESCRYQGFGSCLLQKVEQEAKVNGAGIVILEARDWNVDFFKKHGNTV